MLDEPDGESRPGPGPAELSGHVSVSDRVEADRARERAAETARRHAGELADQEQVAATARTEAGRREAEWWERARERVERTIVSEPASVDPGVIEALSRHLRKVTEWSEAVRERLDLEAAARDRVLAAIHDPGAAVVVPPTTVPPTTPVAAWAARDDPRAILELRLRRCKDLGEAIREVGYALAAVAPPCDAAEARRLEDRLARAERLYRIHCLDRVASLRRLIEGQTADLLRADGLPEFAQALESADYRRILEGVRP